MDEIIHLLKTAAQWVQAKGIEQWGHLLTGEEDAKIQSDIQSDTTYVVEQNNQLVATFNLSNQQNEWDICMWGHREDNAFYLHRFAVGSRYHGKGIGKQILQWMDNQLTGTNCFLRLDCVADNSGLNQLYKHAGFVYLKQKDIDGDLFSLYQKSFVKS
ncbi:GNAT family N-acetyltransferase [Virgibacillus massiliensis]|nr:GNAT family N-acetyltransferase [Virgibacillus massiliensis]MYL43229.1 GNAT family N-acetyltransferase [Virgibacillus massiliensis]